MEQYFIEQVGCVWQYIAPADATTRAGTAVENAPSAIENTMEKDSAIITGNGSASGATRRVFLCADTHIGHSKIAQYCNRPPDWEERTIRNLEALPPDCTLYHLGDWGWTNEERSAWWRSLPYNKVLILGNHNHRSPEWYVAHMGFSSVVTELIIQHEGQDILLTHKPKANPPCINIHGHWHNKSLEDIKEFEPHLIHLLCPLHKRLSLEWEDYKPVELGEFLNR